MSIIGVLCFWNASFDPAVTHYLIYAGTSPGVYDLTLSPLNVGNRLHYWYPVPGPGLYYFAIATVTPNGETNKSVEFQVSVTEPIGVVTNRVRRLFS